MHPGRSIGVELEPGVADGPQSVILDQVANGLAVGMAVLFIAPGRGIMESVSRTLILNARLLCLPLGSIPQEP